MYGNLGTFTKVKTILINTANNMDKFALAGFGQENIRPDDIQPYIDFEKGWKFTEDDKNFLIAYYEDWIQGCIECADGDYAEELAEILNSVRENGVNTSRDLIQTNARDLAEAVHDDIYKYYDDSPDILKLIENSILDMQW